MNNIKGTIKKFQFTNSKLFEYVVLILFLFIFTSAHILAMSDSSNTIDQKRIDSTDFGLDLIALGGLGLIPDIGDWGDHFNISPVINYGLEVPFTKSHYIAFQINGHLWIAGSNAILKESDPYIHLSGQTYWQTRISAIIKFYFNSAKNKFRTSFDFGYMISSKNGYDGIDNSFNFYYRISKIFTASLSERLIYRFTSSSAIFPSIHSVVNIVSLNLYYKFNVTL